MKIKGTK